MIIAIDGCPAATVALLNARLAEIFRTDERVFQFLKSPMGGLVVKAVRTGHGFTITRQQGCVVVRCFKTAQEQEHPTPNMEHPTSNEEEGGA